MKPEQLEELNKLLQDNSLSLPRYRREVTPSGHNLAWLRKHIKARNNPSARLCELLGI